MIDQVVDFRRFRDQVGTAIEIDANRQRAGFDRFFDGDPRKQFAAQLESERAMGRSLLHVRQTQRDFTQVVDGDLRPWQLSDPIIFLKCFKVRGGHAGLRRAVLGIG